MTNQSESTPPQLLPPGAKLPLLHRLANRWIIGPYYSKKIPPEVCRRNYESLNQKLIQMVTNIPVEQRKVRVLVAPMLGLEDSSRYWSLNGVLEHLLIVSTQVEKVILSLSAGQVPNATASTAAVKPSHFEEDMLPEYLEKAPHLLKSLDEKVSQPGMNFSSSLRFSHPWFGPMKAKQWYWVLFVHQIIHYKQVKGIISGLKSGQA